MSGSGGRGGAGKRPNRGPNRGAAPGRRQSGPPAKGRRRAAQTQGPPVVGKRPSRPVLLAVLALMWFAVAIFAFFGLHASWKLIPVVCFAGIGLLYLRGAAGAYLRRPSGPPSTKK